jgi:methylated-DNA-[protein]-cysteine S-methyltransferase
LGRRLSGSTRPFRIEELLSIHFYLLSIFTIYMNEEYTIYYHSPVGQLKISGTEDYISEVAFEDRSKKPEGKNKHQLPLLINCVEQLIQYFNRERRVFELPLHQEGTTFQQEVWNLLVSIPYAKTISYLDLARKTGDPKATRAVASANGKNNIAIIVPCHRVIGSNKELVGYGGGLWRKKWLLEHEMKVAYGVQTLF